MAITPNMEDVKTIGCAAIGAQKTRTCFGDPSPRLNCSARTRSTIVHDLPPKADNGYSSTKKLPCPAADKENVDSSPVEIQSDAAPRRPFRRTPLQDHTNAEIDMDSKSKHRNKRRKYWVTQDGELYNTKAGLLMRSFNIQLKTLE